MTTATEHTIEQLTLEELHGRRHPKNPKNHEIPKLVEAIIRWGYTVPVLLCERTGKIAAGHGRLEAVEDIEKAGRERPRFVQADAEGHWTLPTVRGWSSVDDDELEAYLVADNRQTELGGWDNSLLAEILERSVTTPDGLAGIGYERADVDRLLDSLEQAEPAPPAPPPPATKPKSKAGDIWILGEHRVMCADATDSENTRALMAGGRASMIFTDPPYGQSYESHTLGGIEGDDQRRDELAATVSGALEQALAVATTTAAFYIWHATQTRDDFVYAMREVGLEEVETIVWIKPSAGLGAGNYRRAYEPCFYAARVGETPAFYGERDGETVRRFAASEHGEASIALGRGIVVTDGAGNEVYVSLKIPKRKLRHVRVPPGGSVQLFEGGTGMANAWDVARVSDPVHPTQKPVELARRAIANSSRRHEIVLDSFLGSGSTLVAAHGLERRCYGFEKDPRFADVICARYQALTGTEPILEATGKAQNFL